MKLALCLVAASYAAIFLCACISAYRNWEGADRPEKAMMLLSLFSILAPPLGFGIALWKYV